MAVRVRATGKWGTICIPSPFGILKRPYGGVFSLPDKHARWAIKCGYVVAVEEVTDASQTDPPPDSGEGDTSQSESGEGETPQSETSEGETSESGEGEGDSSQSEPDESETSPSEETTPEEYQASTKQKAQEDLVEFFNSCETTEEITTAIAGIGSATSQKLIEAKPLTWEKVSGILNNRQQQLALSKFS